MPPRHVYWTIIFGGQPTSFRSATREELLPTFKQIQSRHPDAVMKYFARGKLWGSEDEAREALFRRRETRPDRRGPRVAFGGPRFEGRGPRPEVRGPRRDERGPRTPAEPLRDRWKPAPPGERPPDAGPENDRRPARPGFPKPDARTPKPDARGRDWRPGGQHEDSRARFRVPRDVKRRRLAKKFGWKKKKEDEDK